MKQENIQVTKPKYVPTSDFYSQVIDSLQDYAIITMDNDQIINSWSSGASKILGYNTDEVIGKHIQVIFNEDDNQNSIPLLEAQKALTYGRAVDNRWHIRKDGSGFFAYGLVFPLKGINSELLGFVKIMRDLTEEKKSEDAIKKYVKELEELNNHKESILAILSHDLRSPLGVIVMSAELLKLNYDKMSKSEVMTMVDQIIRVSTNELKMFDYLLEWARIKYASDAFSPRNIALKKILNTVLENHEEVVALKNITIQNNIPEDIHVFADEKMLHSIFQNLLSNAVKFSHEGGIVSVTAELKNNLVTIQVKDNGHGIPEELREQLFTPQLSVLANARKLNKGAGIGLLLVKGFLEKNGGTIWVESEEGKGSVFYFTLPVG
jgi:two-component system CheB/CheR fusion protein